MEVYIEKLEIQKIWKYIEMCGNIYRNIQKCMEIYGEYANIQKYIEKCENIQKCIEKYMENMKIYRII